MGRDPKTSSLIRTFLVYIAALAMGILILVKAVLVQTKEGDELRALAEQMQTRFDTVWASRGNIYACDGKLLATDEPIFEVGINPFIIPDDVFNQNIDELCQKLAELFPKKNAKRWKQDITSAKKNNKKDYRIEEKASSAQYLELEKCAMFQECKSGLIKKNQRFKRIHPYDPLAGRTIGYKTEANIVGLESAYDTVLRGKNGRQRQRFLYDTWISIDDENNIDAISGCDIVTTIDLGIQDIAERALNDGLVKNKGLAGCAIVMDVATGEIKAIANLKYNEKTNQYEESQNIAIGLGIEPGSTFKLASMLVLLDQHPEIDINKRNVNVTTHDLVFGGKPMHDEHEINSSGKATPREIFEQSSNKGTALLISNYFDANPEQYIEGLYKLGLNTPINTGMSGEFPPYIKHPTKDKKVWWKTSLSRISIGYEVKLAPIQILTLYNAVANDGRMMKPMFVKEIQKDGITLQTLEPVVLNNQIASQKTIDTIQSMMQGVVTRGTAKRLKPSDYGIAGKTGTAKIYDENTKSYTTRNYNVTFVGYFPTEKPKYSCIVVINGAHQAAATVAAPIFKEIADKIYALHIRGPIETVPERTELKHIEYQPVAELSHYDPTRIPDTKGMNVTDAVYLLESLGLVVSFDGHGQVIGQSIPPGDSLQAGSSIKLTLTKK